jgi:hypothetical protein
MNQQDNDKPTVIEDLMVDEARQDEVKGGSGAVWSGVYDRAGSVDPSR